MNILALDTCLGACSVAVRRGGASATETSDRALMATGHAEALMPMVGRVLAAADLVARDLDRIVVTQGPGTFTGTRIGIAAARGLALATGAEIAVVSSLRALGLTVLKRLVSQPPAFDRLLVAVSARNGEVYVQLLGPAGLEMCEPQVLAISAAAVIEAALRVAVAGSGATDVAAAAAIAGRAFIELPVTAQTDHEPDAAAVLDIAMVLAPVGLAVPLYLRPPDAKPPASPTLPMAKR